MTDVPMAKKVIQLEVYEVIWWILRRKFFQAEFTLVSLRPELLLYPAIIGPYFISVLVPCTAISFILLLPQQLKVKMTSGCCEG